MISGGRVGCKDGDAHRAGRSGGKSIACVRIHDGNAADLITRVEEARCMSVASGVVSSALKR